MSPLVFMVLLESHDICCCITVYLSSSYFMSLIKHIKTLHACETRQQIT